MAGITPLKQERSKCTSHPARKHTAIVAQSHSSIVSHLRKMSESDRRGKKGNYSQYRAVANGYRANDYGGDLRGAPSPRLFVDLSASPFSRGQRAQAAGGRGDSRAGTRRRQGPRVGGGFYSSEPL